MSEDEWIDQRAPDDAAINAWRRHYRSVVEDVISTAGHRMEAEAAKIRKEWPVESERLTMMAQLVVAAVRHGQEYARDSSMSPSRRRLTETRLIEAVGHFNRAADRLRLARDAEYRGAARRRSASRAKGTTADKRLKARDE